MAKDPLDSIPHERTEPRPDFSKPLVGKKLPESLQSTLDDEEKLWDALYEKPNTDSTDSNVRYAAYAARFRTILLSAHRYVAYTSDIGESFRPVAHPGMIRAAYGISWLYIGGDVAYEGFKAYKHNQAVLNPQGALAAAAHKGNQHESKVEQVSAGPHLQPGRVAAIDDYRTVMAQRAIFQTVASMGLPAFTIHSIVRYSGRAMKDIKNVRVRTWGPIGLGLAAVPFLPYIFDKPIEHAVEWSFHKGFEVLGGATGSRPAMAVPSKEEKEKKEL
ncbi:hypothetical protein BT63DRAFT_76627 [Microthyrium microscopicum]|uniref:Mitochondrial fission process protein 1 n=1 Tax=Microthyrium microscopicum TaxID=703497 RepID=A0A6A6U2E1_9PEZI|nr:hypothetical protein BT63DRAFT_76627 [Microthyrium microscopicum]